MILVKKESIRYRQIIFVTDDLETIPDSIKDQDFDVYDKSIDGFLMPFYDSIDGEIVELEDTYDLEHYVNEKKSEIRQAFENDFVIGKFYSSTLGITVDCRRSGTKHDLENVRILKSRMERNSITSETYIGHGGQTATVTITDIDNLIVEMEEFGYNLYVKKWAKEEQINNCTTKEEIQAISW